MTVVPFQLSGVRTADTKAVALDDGSILIEGWSANWEWDRENERFSPEAFSRSLKTFLAGSAPLCWHHQTGTVVGRVLDAEIRRDGVWVKAVIDPQPASSPHRWIWEAVKRGRIASLSWGGIFSRKSTPQGPVIDSADLLELSICPISVGRGTSFEVVHGKALRAPSGKAVNARGEYVDAPVDAERRALRATVDRLEIDVLDLQARRLHRALGAIS